MPLNPAETELLADLIRTVQTLAQQIVTVHLQVGAVRTLLERKGFVTETEFRTAISELDTVSLVGELVGTIPDIEEFFAGLLRRLAQAD